MSDQFSPADVEQMVGPTYQVTHSCDVSDTSPELRTEWAVHRLNDDSAVVVSSEVEAREFVRAADRSQAWTVVRRRVTEWEESER